VRVSTTILLVNGTQAEECSLIFKIFIESHKYRLVNDAGSWQSLKLLVKMHVILTRTPSPV